MKSHSLFKFKIITGMTAGIIILFIFSRPDIKRPFSPHSAYAEGFCARNGMYPCDERLIKYCEERGIELPECRHNYILGIPVNFGGTNRE